MNKQTKEDIHATIARYGTRIKKDQLQDLAEQVGLRHPIQLRVFLILDKYEENRLGNWVKKTDPRIVRFQVDRGHHPTRNPRRMKSIKLG